MENSQDANDTPPDDVLNNSSINNTEPRDGLDYTQIIPDLDEITTVSDENPLIQSACYRRNNKDTFHPGSLNVLSTKYESLDYDTVENYLLLDEEQKKGYKFIVRKLIAKWIIFLLIGMITALIACVIDVLIDSLCSLKYEHLQFCKYALKILNRSLKKSNFLFVF